MSKGNVLITGVSSGIGLSSARKFADNGYTVFGSVRKQVDAERVQAELGTAFTPLIFDVTDHEAISLAVKELADKIGNQGLKCLINNSGIAISGPLEILEVSAYRYQFEVNYFGLIAVTKAFLPFLGTQKDSPFSPGKIINISSVSSKNGMPFLTPYASSKAAVDSLSDGLRRELMIYGIDVVTLNPGPIETPIWEKAKKPNEAMMNSNYADSIGQFYKMMKKESREAIKVEDFANIVFKTFEQKSPKTSQVMMVGKFKKYIIPKYFLSSRLFDRILKKMLKM